MCLFDTFELLEEEKKLRLTRSLDNKTTQILIVEIDKFFRELMNEHNKCNGLLSKITNSSTNGRFSN